MDSSEIYEYATSKGWVLAHEGDYTHVYEMQLPATTAGCHGLRVPHKYLFVSMSGGVEYDGRSGDTRLVLPHKGNILAAEDDEDAKILTWWLDGNEGSEDDWWNQLPEEEKN